MASSTQILLLKDVAHLGRSGEIKHVARGYARNFLLPKKLALYADKNTLRLKEKLQHEREQQAANDRAEAQQLASQLQNLILACTVKVDPEGHMYGSVTRSDISDLFEKEGYTVAKQYINLKSPIKQVGVYDIELQLKEEVTCSVKLKVNSNEQDASSTPVQETNVSS